MTCVSVINTDSSLIRYFMSGSQFYYKGNKNILESILKLGLLHSTNFGSCIFSPRISILSPPWLNSNLPLEQKLKVAKKCHLQRHIKYSRRFMTRSTGYPAKWFSLFACSSQFIWITTKTTLITVENEWCLIFLHKIII